MMMLIQPLLLGGHVEDSGRPAEATTAEEVERLLIEAWQGGLKCVALYRDNCKVPAAQPGHGRLPGTSPARL
ncbi:MAG: hypothetical protein R2716_11660 [Microthrixaceae bacterium]